MARVWPIIPLLCWPLVAAQPAHPAPKATGVARRWMKTMPLRDRVAQLLFIPFHGAAPNTRTREYRQFVKLVRDTHVGGLVLVNWSNGRVVQKAEPYALAAFLNRMQRLAKIPLIVSADFERGASMRVDSTTVFPHAMAFGAAGDPLLARYEGEVTAREARALGVHWVFFPVADVNRNPDNPIINIRSYGENPEDVSKFVVAFIEGARADGRNRVLTTAKHFPGHGDTSVDTHLNMAVIGADRAHLERVELAPFRAAIRAGVDSVMTAHIAVPALAPPDVPATLSPEIVTGLLRTQMGFQGLVVTDALEMGGIAKGYSAGEAAVKALEAGVDVLVMTPDPEAALKAVLAAVRSGRLTEKRINQSVERILTAKQLVGLDRRRFTDPEAIGEEVSAPEANQRAQEIADRAVTLVKNDRHAMPLGTPGRACHFLLAESRYSSEGQAWAQEVRRREKGAQIVALDPTVPLPSPDAVCESFVVAAFASVSAYAGNVALRGEYPKLIESLAATGKPVVLVALGNPYLLHSFPHVTAYLATYSTVPPSEVAAVKALFGEIAIRGRLPVTIPGMAKYGDGIMVPARAGSVSGR
jgi:beta-N-acetylhexosaminidase